MRLLSLKTSDLTYDVMLYSIGSRFPIPLGKGKQTRMAFFIIIIFRGVV